MGAVVSASPVSGAKSLGTETRTNVTSAGRGQPEPESGRGWPELSLTHINWCTKNPHHKSFIPACNFSRKHLPRGFRQKWRLIWVRALIELTVKLSVNVISPDRPETYPHSNEPYPFHLPGGGIRPRTGSGFVHGVYKCGQWSERKQDKTCECWECRGSSNPKRNWWEIGIATAVHVAFDDMECKNTDVRLFFDSKESSGDVVKVKGHEILYKDVDGDWCRFKICTHHEALGARLEKALRCYLDLRDEHQIGLNAPVFVVSHPHGCSKYVTVGKMVGRGVERGLRQIRYTADTCPGSSGGLVAWGGLVKTDDGVVLDGDPRRLSHREGFPGGINGSSGAGWLW